MGLAERAGHAARPFGEEADDEPLVEERQRLAQRGAVGCAAVDRERPQIADEPAESGVREELALGHVEDRARHGRAEHDRVEVVQVVRHHQHRPAARHVAPAAHPEPGQGAQQRVDRQAQHLVGRELQAAARRGSGGGAGARPAARLAVSRAGPLGHLAVSRARRPRP